MRSGADEQATAVLRRGASRVVQRPAQEPSSRSGGVRPAPRPAAAVGLVVAPLLAGVVAAGLGYAIAERHVFYVQSRLWLALLVLGALASLLAAVVVLVGRWTRRAWERGVAEAARTAAEDHRRFLLRLDHELKNPVTALRAGLANLTTQLDGAQTGGPDLARVFDSIATQSQRLASLVEDLRKLAELETRPIEWAPVHVTELLAEVHEVTEAGDRTVTLALHQTPWPLAPVAGDRDLLFLALHNLLGNAVKFTRPGDRIELRTRDDGGQVVVEVADTGPGIPADELGQVWDELARGRAARGTPGMGLGLALVRAIISRHGGTVSARSREGHGTLVAVRLPAAPPPAV